MDWRVSQEDVLTYLRGERGMGDKQERLTQALNWLKDNNVHGSSMPKEHADVPIASGLLYFNKEHRIYDIIEPIKSWLGTPTCEKCSGDMTDAFGGMKYCVDCGYSPEMNRDKEA